MVGEKWRSTDIGDLLINHVIVIYISLFIKLSHIIRASNNHVTGPLAAHGLAHLGGRVQDPKT
jgi:hypothetical protein